MKDKGWSIRDLARETGKSRRILNKLFSSSPSTGTHLGTFATVAVALNVDLFEAQTNVDESPGATTSVGETESLSENFSRLQQPENSPSADVDIDHTVENDSERQEGAGVRRQQDTQEVGEVGSDDDEQETEEIYSEDNAYFEDEFDTEAARHDTSSHDYVTNQAAAAGSDLERVEATDGQSDPHMRYDWEQNSNFEPDSRDEGVTIPEAVDPPQVRSPSSTPTYSNTDAFALLREKSALTKELTSTKEALVNSLASSEQLLNEARKNQIVATASYAGGATTGLLVLNTGEWTLKKAVATFGTGLTMYGAGKFLEKGHPKSAHIVINTGLGLSATALAVTAIRWLNDVFRKPAPAQNSQETTITQQNKQDASTNVALSQTTEAPPQADEALVSHKLPPQPARRATAAERSDEVVRETRTDSSPSFAGISAPTTPPDEIGREPTSVPNGQCSKHVDHMTLEELSVALFGSATPPDEIGPEPASVPNCQQAKHVDDMTFEELSVALFGSTMPTVQTAPASQAEPEQTRSPQRLKRFEEMNLEELLNALVGTPDSTRAPDTSAAPMSETGDFSLLREHFPALFGRYAPETNAPTLPGTGDFSLLREHFPALFGPGAPDVSAPLPPRGSDFSLIRQRFPKLFGPRASGTSAAPPPARSDRAGVELEPGK